MIRMATDESEPIDDLLTCSICLEWYQSPRRLPCPHSYCLRCLRAMVKPADKHLRCPECRVSHAVPDSGVDGFPLDVKLNHFIRALRTKETKTSETTTTKKETEIVKNPPENPAVEAEEQPTASEEEQQQTGANEMYVGAQTGLLGKTYHFIKGPNKYAFVLGFWYTVELLMVIFVVWPNEFILVTVLKCIILLVFLVRLIRHEYSHGMDFYSVPLLLYIVCTAMNIVQLQDLLLFSDYPQSNASLSVRFVVCSGYFAATWGFCDHLIKVRQWQHVMNYAHMYQRQRDLEDAMKPYRPRQRKTRNKRK